MGKRLLIQFARYGPYRHARLNAVHEALAPLNWVVIGFETAGYDATYAWDESKSNANGPRVVTVFPGRVHEEITAAECKGTLYPLLDSLSPYAIAVAGRASPDALSPLRVGLVGQSARSGQLLRCEIRRLAGRMAGVGNAHSDGAFPRE